MNTSSPLKKPVSRRTWPLLVGHDDMRAEVMDDDNAAPAHRAAPAWKALVAEAIDRRRVRLSTG